MVLVLYLWAALKDTKLYIVSDAWAMGCYGTTPAVQLIEDAMVEQACRATVL